MTSAASVYRCPECGSEQPEPGTCGRCPGTVREADSAASTCLHCGHKLDHRVKEIEDELLERCPTCGAYRWEPEPIKTWEQA